MAVGATNEWAQRQVYDVSSSLISERVPRGLSRCPEVLLPQNNDDSVFPPRLWLNVAHMLHNKVFSALPRWAERISPFTSLSLTLTDIYVCTQHPLLNNNNFRGACLRRNGDHKGAPPLFKLQSKENTGPMQQVVVTCEIKLLSRVRIPRGSPIPTLSLSGQRKGYF